MARKRRADISGLGTEKERRRLFSPQATTTLAPPGSTLPSSSVHRLQSPPLLSRQTIATASTQERAFIPRQRYF